MNCGYVSSLQFPKALQFNRPLRLLSGKMYLLVSKSGRNDVVLSPVQGPGHGGRYKPHDAQLVHAPGCGSARCQIVVELHRRSTRSVWRPHGCFDRAASVADLGRRKDCNLPEEAARRVQVYPRPISAAAQSRVYAERDRGNHADASEPRQRLVDAWLLW